MVRPVPIHFSANIFPLPLALGLFISVSVLVALCVRHSKQFHTRDATKSTSTHDSKVAPRSPLLLPKKINTCINNVADHPYRNNREEFEADELIANPSEGFGEGGLWQKSILMGEKCQPPEFSGVVFYDSSGNRISELPRSPRAIPVRSLSSFPASPNVQ